MLPGHRASRSQYRNSVPRDLYYVSRGSYEVNEAYPHPPLPPKRLLVQQWRRTERNCGISEQARHGFCLICHWARERRVVVRLVGRHETIYNLMRLVVLSVAC